VSDPAEKDVLVAGFRLSRHAADVIRERNIDIALVELAISFPDETFGPATARGTS
jgi:hypothetical protein